MSNQRVVVLTDEEIEALVYKQRSGAYSSAIRKLEAVEAAFRAADEKRRELAQAAPEGQEYAYRVCWDLGRDGIGRTKPMSLGKAEQFASELDCSPWIERALLGDWERVEQ